MAQIFVIGQSAFVDVVFGGVMVVVVGVACILYLVDTFALLCHLRGFFFLVLLIWDVSNRLLLINIISS